MNTGKYTIDRFEGEHAVLLYRDNENIEVIKKRSELPKDAAEGDILFLKFDEKDKLLESKILKEETECVRRAARGLINKLKNK